MRHLPPPPGLRLYADLRDLHRGDPAALPGRPPNSLRPYVFEPAEETRDFAPGDPLSFDLLLFRAAEILHVGKGTTFGLGWITVEA